MRGIGPRIAEHMLDATPLNPYQAYEDMRLKGQEKLAAHRDDAAAVRLEPRDVSAAVTEPDDADGGLRIGHRSLPI